MADDKDQCPCPNGTDIGVLKVRFDNLSATVAEVRDLIKRIDETVGIVRLVQFQTEQNNREFTSLTSKLHDITKQVATLEDDVSEQMAAMQKELEKKITAVSATGTTRENTWKEKYNVFRGVMLAVSAVTMLLSGISVYMVKETTAIIAESYQYTLQLKTIDAIEILKHHLQETQGGSPK